MWKEMKERRESLLTLTISPQSNIIPILLLYHGVWLSKHPRGSALKVTIWTNWKVKWLDPGHPQPKFHTPTYRSPQFTLLPSLQALGRRCWTSPSLWLSHWRTLYMMLLPMLCLAQAHRLLRRVNKGRGLYFLGTSLGKRFYTQSFTYQISFSLCRSSMRKILFPWGISEHVLSPWTFFWKAGLAPSMFQNFMFTDDWVLWRLVGSGKVKGSSLIARVTEIKFRKSDLSEYWGERTLKRHPGFSTHSELWYRVDCNLLTFSIQEWQNLTHVAQPPGFLSYNYVEYQDLLPHRFLVRTKGHTL